MGGAMSDAARLASASSGAGPSAPVFPIDVSLNGRERWLIQLSPETGVGLSGRRDSGTL